MKPSSLTPFVPALILPFLALAAPAQQMTGTSHPDDTSESTVQTDHYVKPSKADVPAYQDSYPATSSQPRLLIREQGSSVSPVDAGGGPSPASVAVTVQGVPYVPAAPAPIETANAAVARAGADPSDGQIVLDVPSRPHELHRGILMHARLRESLSTQRTPEGAVFTAELLSDVGHHGEVMLPAGSLIRGHVTSVHGGKRITGGASMHLRPETVSLPDGTLYHLDAQLTDLNSTQDLRVNDEGTIVLRSNAKAAAAVVGGIAGTAAVTGAVIGGGVGAAVGAIAGAGVATAVYLKRDVQESLPAGTDVIFALDQALVITPR